MSNEWPFMGVPEDYAEEKNELPIFKEYAWDFEKNERVIENGNFKIVERNEALRVWIYKAIKTDRYLHLVYDWSYGCEIKELIGKNYTKGLTESEAKRYIKEAILINPYIDDVNVLECKLKESTLTVSLDIDTIYGKERFGFE